MSSLSSSSSFNLLLLFILRLPLRGEGRHASIKTLPSRKMRMENRRVSAHTDQSNTRDIIMENRAPSKWKITRTLLRAVSRRMPERGKNVTHAEHISHANVITFHAHRHTTHVCVTSLLRYCRKVSFHPATSSRKTRDDPRVRWISTGLSRDSRAISS